MTKARVSKPIPTALPKKGVMNVGLASENSAISTSGITVTTRAESRAWAV